MGPKTSDNKGAEFEKQIDSLYRDAEKDKKPEEEDEEEKEEKEEQDD